MANIQETIADIRKDAEAKFRELVEAYMQRRSTFQTTVGAMQAFNTLFDRIEAAYKRELQDALDCGGIVGAAHERKLSKNASKNGVDFGQFGDAAKLREVVERVVNALSGKMADAPAAMTSHEVAILKQCRAALAAPATAENSSAVGDCAKLREACEALVSEIGGYLADGLDVIWCGISGETIKKVRAALAAPPRNCDKYATADEALKAQEQMFNDSNFANGECKLGCPECDNPRVGCKIAWLFAPATDKEGGDDGQ